MLHEGVTYNRYYGTFAEFTAATLQFLKTISRRKFQNPGNALEYGLMDFYQETSQREAHGVYYSMQTHP